MKPKNILIIIGIIILIAIAIFFLIKYLPLLQVIVSGVSPSPSSVGSGGSVVG